MSKDKSMAFRFRHGVREMLQELAEHERRNVTNYLEVLIEREYEKIKKDVDIAKS